MEKNSTKSRTRYRPEMLYSDQNGPKINNITGCAALFYAKENIKIDYKLTVGQADLMQLHLFLDDAIY